jgi:hypothetical protein
VKEAVEDAPAKTETTEEVAEIDAPEQIFRRATPLPTSSIVFGALLRVGEHGVGFGDLFKFFFGIGCFITARMIFQSEITEGGLDRLLVGIARDAEYFIVVALCRWHGGAPALHVSVAWLLPESLPTLGDWCVCVATAFLSNSYATLPV